MQASFVAALETWGKAGIPANPAAWLLTTARHRAIDAIRRERTRRTFAPDLARSLDGEWTLTTTVREAFGEDVIRDDQLRMIFLCCRPELTSESQLTLILRTLCGLSVPATARALLTTESTIQKRMVRIRQRLEAVDFALPRSEDRPAALETAHAALYLLFNEGHLSTDEEPIHRELCRAAMDLLQLIADEPSLCTSDTLGLLALMCFQAARMDSRLDAKGGLVSLDRQDRTRWDRELIGRGYACLVRASRMGTVVAGRYHLEAAIAARHCAARTFSETDWASISRLYDRLLERWPSPLVELNRAVARIATGPRPPSRWWRRSGVPSASRGATPWPQSWRTCTPGSGKTRPPDAASKRRSRRPGPATSASSSNCRWNGRGPPTREARRRAERGSARSGCCAGTALPARSRPPSRPSRHG